MRVIGETLTRVSRMLALSRNINARNARDHGRKWRTCFAGNYGTGF